MRHMTTPFLHKIGGTWHWKPSKAARRLGFKNVALGADEMEAHSKGRQLWEAYLAKRTEAAQQYEGTFRHLRDVYYESREWKRLAAETKRDYKRYIDRVIVKRFGDLQVTTVDADVIRVMHESMAAAPYAANQCVKVLGTLLACGMARPSLFPGLPAVNPCKAIKLYGVKEGVTTRDRTWTDEEVKAFDGKADAELLMARLLYGYTGQRTIDVLAMLDTDYKVDAEGRWLHVAQHKSGKRLWIYCHADLAPAIEAHIVRHRKARPDKIGVPLIQNTRGETFNRRVFVARWDRIAVKAGIVTLGVKEGERRSRENPTRHDLRRTATTLLYEADCTDDQVSAITGLSRSMLQRQVYNVRSRAHAKAGIKKLEEYRK